MTALSEICGGGFNSACPLAFSGGRPGDWGVDLGLRGEKEAAPSGQG